MKKYKNALKRIIDSPGFALIGFFLSLIGLIISLTNDSIIFRLVCAILLFLCLCFIKKPHVT